MEQVQDRSMREIIISGRVGGRNEQRVVRYTVSTGTIPERPSRFARALALPEDETPTKDKNRQGRP
jgi:hypothetical protein